MIHRLEYGSSITLGILPSVPTDFFKNKLYDSMDWANFKCNFEYWNLFKDFYFVLYCEMRQLE